MNRTCLSRLVLSLLVLSYGLNFVRLHGDQVDSRLLAELKLLASAKWNQSRIALNSLECRANWKFRSVVSMPSKSDDLIEQDYSGLMVGDKFKVLHKSGIELSNPRYIASLKNGKTDNSFVLTGGLFRRDGVVVKRDFREAEFRQLLTCGYMDYLGLDSLLASESQLRRLERSAQSTIVGEWNLGKEIRGISGGVAMIELDPANAYRLVRAHRTVNLDRGSSTTKTEIEYFQHDSLGSIPRKLSITETSTKVAGFKQVDEFQLLELTQLESASGVDAEFYLPHYGVSESSLAAFDIPPKKRYSRFLLIAVCVLIGAVLFGLSHWYSKRQRS